MCITVTTIVLVNGIILWTYFFFQMETTSQNRKQKGKDEKIPEAEKIDGKIRKKGCRVMRLMVFE